MESILGQTSAVSLLKKYIVSNSFPPSFLFLGPDGIGRKTTAVEFAKTINCEISSSLSPCGRCYSCELISKGQHPYVVVVDFEWQKRFLEKELAEISIDTIREIQRLLSLRPTFGKKRVVVIDSAEKMSKEAANSFLKTLEQPPDDTIIILISNSRKQLLPTIISRSQIINFVSLPDEIIAMKIKEIKKDIDEKNLRFFVEISEGSLAKAVSFLNKWDEYLSLKDDFEALELKGFKDVDLAEFLEFLVAYYKKNFNECPEKYLEIWDAIYTAKRQNSLGINKNMILVQLHKSVIGETLCS